MIFRDLHGKRMMSLHAPNVPPNERMVLIPIGENENG